MIHDFQRSYMRWDKPHNPNDPRPDVRHNTPLGNRVRILIEAVLEVTDRDGNAETFFLIAPCRTEWVYAPQQLFQVPSREFRCIYSRDRERGVGRGLVLDRPESLSIPAEGWELEIELYEVEDTRVHDSDSAVAAAATGSSPLVGRTSLSDPDGAYKCMLEYPIKTMNFRPETPSFQVDTGPVILPDFDSAEDLMIDRLVMAHVAYNRFDHAEFIIRRPTSIGEGETMALHYSEVREFEASNQVISGG